jgi:thiamine-monophosphate kinase
MLKASECGALINIDRIPITTDLDDLNYGDDYDLCFTIPASKLKNNYFKIGEVTQNKEIKLISEKGFDVSIKGYEHF